MRPFRSTPAPAAAPPGAKAGRRPWLALGLAVIGWLALAGGCGGQAGPGTSGSPGQGPAGPSGGAGFTGLFQRFPDTAQYASPMTAAAMAANPWMRGARFALACDGICQDALLPLAQWSRDIANVTGFRNPLDLAMPRIVADPSASWDIADASAVANMDAVVAGAVAVARAAGTSQFLYDPENYRTPFLLADYDQTSLGAPLLNSPLLDRPQMCARIRSFGQAFGSSLWSRMPDATLYTLFGPTVVLAFTQGTGIPASWPDAEYAADPRYNMLPYFFLGLLDACPATGRIADYIERSYYDFTGLASIQRNLTASRNWVKIFFPNETAAIAKSATCWVPLPLIFANPYFDASYGSIHPGAYYVRDATDQANYFTRNALYCLQQTPAGFLPGIYVEAYDPWGSAGTATNLPAAWETALANALAVREGSITLDRLFDVDALHATLLSAFAGRPDWRAECR